MYAEERGWCSLIYHMGVVGTLPVWLTIHQNYIFLLWLCLIFISNYTLLCKSYKYQTLDQATLDILDTEKLLLGRDWRNSSLM